MKSLLLINFFVLCMTQNVLENAHCNNTINMMDTTCDKFIQSFSSSSSTCTRFGREIVNCENKHGFSPLSVFSAHNQVNIVEFLLNNGADVNKACKMGRTALFEASFRGYSGVVKCLLRYGANVNQANNDGLTPLYIASRNGFWEVVKMLVDKNAETETETTAGWTALIAASGKGRVRIVEFLIEKGANVSHSSKDGGWTPLFAASDYGHERVVDILINKGKVDVNQALSNGETPLYGASYRGHFEVVRILLNHGALVNKSTNLEQTPLFAACFKGHREIVSLLLDHKADFNQVNIDGFSPLVMASREGHSNAVELLLKQNVCVNCMTKSGISPLLAATWNRHKNVVVILLTNVSDVNDSLLIASHLGDLELVKLFITHNANVNYSSHDNFITPLFEAVRCNHEDVVRALIENRVNVNFNVGLNMTALYQACENGNYNITKLLLKSGADINRKRFDGATALHAAIGSGTLEIVKLLIRKNASLNAVTDLGYSPLAVACFEGHIQIAKALLAKEFLDYRANVNQQDESGRTPLIIAVYQGNMELVELLISEGASIDTSTKQGESALFVAVKTNQTKIAKFLLDKDAAIDIVNVDNITPLFIAHHKNFNELKQILVSRGADMSKGGNQKDSDLSHACQSGNLRLVYDLVIAGANIRACGDPVMEGWLRETKERSSVLSVVEDQFSFEGRYGCKVEFLVDGKEYFSSLAATFKHPSSFIYIIGWDFDPNLRLERPSGETLVEILAKKKQAGADIKVLLWEDALIPQTYSIKTVQAEFERRGMVGCIALVKRTKFSSHHQKAVIVGGTGSEVTAYIGGIDLAKGRFDDSQHQLFPMDQVEFGEEWYAPESDSNLEQPTPKSQQRQPWHDIQMKILGPAVCDVLSNFVERWNEAKRYGVLPFQHSCIKKDVGGNWFVQILRSMQSPKRAWNFDEKATSGIELAYVHAIMNAQHSVYIENQFFVSGSNFWIKKRNDKANNRIAIAIVARITEKILAGEDFYVALVLPLYPEGTWSNGLLDMDSKKQRKILENQFSSMEFIYTEISRVMKWMNVEGSPAQYFGVYCLGKVEQGFRNMIYVHSKLMIVDGQVVVCGSANINQRSLSGSTDTELVAITWQYNRESPTTLAPLNDSGAFDLLTRLHFEHLSNQLIMLNMLNVTLDKRLLSTLARSNWHSYLEGRTMASHLMTYPISWDNIRKTLNAFPLPTSQSKGTSCIMSNGHNCPAHKSSLEFLFDRGSDNLYGVIDESVHGTY